MSGGAFKTCNTFQRFVKSLKHLKPFKCVKCVKGLGWGALTKNGVKTQLNRLKPLTGLNAEEHLNHLKHVNA